MPDYKHTGIIFMTVETRKRLAKHFFAMGETDHPYVKEFGLAKKAEPEVYVSEKDKKRRK